MYLIHYVLYIPKTHVYNTELQCNILHMLYKCVLNCIHIQIQHRSTVPINIIGNNGALHKLNIILGEGGGRNKTKQKRNSELRS